MCLGEVVTVIAIDAAAGTATTASAGGQRRVSLALQPEAAVGDRVVVHTGFVVASAEVADATGTDATGTGAADAAGTGAEVADAADAGATATDDTVDRHAPGRYR